MNLAKTFLLTMATVVIFNAKVDADWTSPDFVDTILCG
jgi:hypothetical protein